MPRIKETGAAARQTGLPTQAEKQPWKVYEEACEQDESRMKQVFLE